MKSQKDTVKETGVPAPPTPSRLSLIAFNTVFSTILRSPFHGLLSNNFILLSITGRKSGKVYTFPVGYLREGDELRVISPRGWWKNLRDENTSVTVLLKGQKRRGVAEAFYGNEVVADEFQRRVQKFPSLIRMYHIEKDAQGQPEPESVRQAARPLALICIHL